MAIDVNKLRAVATLDENRRVVIELSHPRHRHAIGHVLLGLPPQRHRAWSFRDKTFKFTRAQLFDLEFGDRHYTWWMVGQN